jgi:hypothetical protein
VAKIRGALDFGVKRGQMLEALLADVAHHFEAAIGQGTEITDEIGSPIPATDYSDFYLLCHVIS